MPRFKQNPPNFFRIRGFVQYPEGTGREPAADSSDVTACRFPPGVRMG